ncbi:hypothetical protein F511_35471 [Dorcoceras hygrometricum]|uniref:DUF674 family protein n=1 Tax=Dorcoceras hygrometricum TaxID=472368 RepID=A0A2Z7DFB9_9LAMI|nr:hypothetical protein F511_35471 [Dorcoceras hygrometricum]
MAATEEDRFYLKVMTIKESCKVLYAEVDSEFADVLLSFLTLPLGTIMRLLIEHYGNNAPILGSLKSLYVGLQNLDGCHFWTEAGKLMLLNPRNSSDMHCSRLKLQIDDICPIQCFVCCNGTCTSVYDKVKCLCPNSAGIMTKRDLEIEPPRGEDSLEEAGIMTKRDLEIEPPRGEDSLEEGVFTVQKASFLLTDDLQVLPNSPISLLRILKLNGVEDTNVIEERTLIFGLKEIMELLKGSLVSRTPLTDIIGGISAAAASYKTRRNFLMSAICEQDELPRTSVKITIEALVHYSTKRILLAQSRQDFVDFLFSLLTIPLGCVQFLLDNRTCFWSINNLYRSISKLEIGEHMRSKDTKSRLLDPELPPYYLSSSQIFPLEEQSSPQLYRLRDGNQLKLFESLPKDIWREMKMIDPKGKDCFVKGPTTFMVTDDLVVSIPSSTSMISILNQMKIPLSEVKVRELEIGIEEALSILKASLISTHALTEGLKPFLKRQANWK